jgi:SAM-dependent methyltransferase
MKITCPCCLNSSSVELKYKPLAHFHNLNVKFDYYYCNNCAILWRDNTLPIDFSQYDDNYYSFNVRKNLLLHIKDIMHLILFNIYYYLSLSLFPRKEYVLHRVFRLLKIRKSLHILDVGCGGGIFLKRLRSYGYKNILGIDPNAKQSNDYGIPISKTSIDQVTKKFHVINAHHVIEHVTNPREFLSEIYRCLLPEGLAIVTFPRFCKVLEEDGNYSYLLQAPDHNTLLNDKCFRALSEELGFIIDFFEIDSSGTFEWLVVGALWKKGINVKGYNKKYLNNISSEELFQLRSKADKFEKNGDGGNALYILKKIEV